MRIGGLASGMDIDQIVYDLMKAERMKVDTLYQQKQTKEWQKADYREMNLKLRALYNSTFDMKLQSSYLKYKVSGALENGSKIDPYFTVSANAGAVPGNYEIKVNQVAEHAKIKSTSSITKPLAGQELTVPVDINESNNTLDITIDGVKKTITLAVQNYDGSEGKTLSDLASDINLKINEAFNTEKVDVKIDQNRIVFQPKEGYQKFSMILEGRDALGALGFPDSDMVKYEPINPNTPLKDQWNKFSSNPLNNDKLSFKVNDKQFTFDFSENGAHKNYSLNDILSKISSDKDADARAYYDDITDKVVISSKQTGAAQTVKVEDTDGSRFFEVLGFGAGNTAASGKNAKILFDDTIIEKATNEFTVNDINLSLKKPMTEKVTLTVAQDIDSAVENIKKYVELYNETIDVINKKILEERFRKFPPLTDEQKSVMKEDDIKRWEEKAKSGLLRADPILSNVVDKMRSAVYMPVKGLPEDFDSLYDIGITTGGWTEKGKLYINETKLREALAKDSESVMKLFNQSNENDSSQNGIAVRVYDILKTGIDDITKKAGGGEFQIYDDSILGKQIRDIGERIDDMEERLIRTEERYWQKFTAMEKAIQYANQQSMWLTMQMGQYSGQ